MTKPTTLPALWPTNFANIEIEGQSPLSSIWIIGDPGVGKSTFITTIPAVKPLVLDLEGSYTTLRFLSPMTRIDLREKSREYLAKAKGILEYSFFLAFMDELEKIKPGEYDVIAIDPFSDLYFGSFFYVQNHPEIFGKSAERYRGKEGVIAAWADAVTLWKDLVKRLESLCQTVIFTSHVKDIYDKSTQTKTGIRDGRGANITNAVSLKLWLFGPNNADPDGNKPGSPKFKGRHWAWIEKSRLTQHAKSEGSKFPRIAPLLPAKLLPEVYKDGSYQSYPELIYNYMAKPAPDYGDLNVIHGDPTANAETEQAEIQTKLEVLKLEAQQALANAKREMAERLIKDGLYETGAEIADAILTLNLDEDVQDINKMLSVEKALRQHKAV